MNDMYDQYDEAMDEASELLIDYTLEVGESIEEIAKAIDVSVEEIVELNPELTAEQYIPGRRIRVPFRWRRYPRLRPHPYPWWRHRRPRPRPY